MTLGFTRPGRWLVLALLMGGSTGCFLHHGARTPKAPPPAVPTDVELGRAMQLFRHGEFRKAQIILQRLTFELGASPRELAPARARAHRILPRGMLVPARRSSAGGRRFPESGGRVLDDRIRTHRAVARRGRQTPPVARAGGRSPLRRNGARDLPGIGRS